jgi:hypothetical protein
VGYFGGEFLQTYTSQELKRRSAIFRKVAGSGKASKNQTDLSRSRDEVQYFGKYLGLEKQGKIKQI